MKLAKNVVLCDTDHGAVLLDQGSGEYWTLNQTGALVVRLLLEGSSVDEAVDEVVELFPVDRSTAAADVADLLDQIREASLVVASQTES